MLAALRARGIELGLAADGRIHVRPASKLTSAEGDFLRGHYAEMRDLLTPLTPKDEELVIEPTVDDVIRSVAEEEERRLARQMAPPPRRVVFRTARGAVSLRDLLPHEARDLEARGKLSADEVREWARAYRSRTLLW